MLNRPQIEADIAAAQADIPQPGDLSLDEIAAAVRDRVKGAARCIGHADVLLGELDRVTEVLGRLAAWPNRYELAAYKFENPSSPGIDYLSIGRAALAEFEASNPEKGRE